MIKKLFCEDFEGNTINFVKDTDMSADKKWFCNYMSTGTITSKDGTLYMKPEYVPNATRACLVTSSSSSTSTFGDFNANFSMMTESQNRTPTPNAWETAWFMWHFTDNWHHYFMSLHSDGQIEIGRKDYSQKIEQEIYLYTSGPGKVANPLKTWHEYDLSIIDNNRIVLLVDKVLVCDITDNGTIGSDSAKNYAKPAPPSAQIRFGKMGFYCEDSAVRFDNLIVRVLS